LLHVDHVISSVVFVNIVIARNSYNSVLTATAVAGAGCKPVKNSKFVLVGKVEI
jgi:hypothetical protein